MKKLEALAHDEYRTALHHFPWIDQDLVKKLSDFLEIPPPMLGNWRLNPVINNNFLRSRLRERQRVLGENDRRVTGPDSGIAGHVSSDSVPH
jgi:hypothetical protein